MFFIEDSQKCQATRSMFQGFPMRLSKNRDQEDDDIGENNDDDHDAG